MKAGIKIGPRDWQQVLPKVNPDCLEVWFRLDWYKKFVPMFKELRSRKIKFGLHFWAMIDGKYLPNLMSNKKEIARQTFKLILKTIDLAAGHKATYVNFHPESYRQPLLDLDNATFTIEDFNEPINRQKSFKQLLYYLVKIRQHADKKGIIPFLETISRYVPSDFKDIKKGRLDPQKSEGLETEKFFKLTKLGYPICFDIGHTASQLITKNRDKLFEYVYKAAKKMLPSIGLMHITTNRPPFNGTDSHNGILKKDFKQGVVPNKKQLVKLLSLFKDKDIWLIPEPYEKMVENYKELRKIVREIERN